MAMTLLNTPAQRIGVQKGEILAHAVPFEVLTKVGDHYEFKKNMGDTIKMRSFLMYGATAAAPNRFFANGTGDRANAMVALHATQEGVTPPPSALVPRDVTVVLQEYAIQYGYTNRTADLSEDDIPRHQKEIVGEQMGLVREMVRYGATRACTNQFYGGTGTSRATVNDKVTLSLLRKVSRALKADHAKMVTSVLDSSPDFGVSAVEAAYVIYGHTDLDADFRDLAGFKTVAEYGTRSTISPYEIGTIENMRVVLTPELIPYQDAGAAVGTTGCESTSGSNIDVYPMIVCGKDAWGDLSLRGESSFDITHLKPGQKDKADIHGQRGYVGALWYDAATVTNNGWMAVVNVGTSDL